MILCTDESVVAIRDDCEVENVAARGNFEQYVFDYEVLRDSTGNFDRDKMLGRGGFGEVFKVFNVKGEFDGSVQLYIALFAGQF